MSIFFCSKPVILSPSGLFGSVDSKYTLFNEDHPNGSAYSAEAIENMPMIEAFPDENNIMIHKLITLPRGTSKLPIVTANVNKVTLIRLLPDK